MYNENGELNQFQDDYDNCEEIQFGMREGFEEEIEDYEESPEMLNDPIWMGVNVQ